MRLLYFMGSRLVKRLFDFLFALVVLLLVWPVLLVAALAIKLESRGPIFFIQRRPSLGGKPFPILKFRTMTHKPDRVADREILAGDPELTRIGGLLRRTKIDELPQVLNVLAGQMSVVGPRPGLLEQVEDYDANGRRRLEVRPGITGLAQVNGSIYLPWPERWRYDAWYVENQTLSLDVRIIMKTFRAVWKGEAALQRDFDTFLASPQKP